MDLAQFRNPPSQYRSAPFWSWNGRLTEEELVRQESHVEALRKILPKDSGSQGRRLDHLFQEMQREVSTLLAKSHLLELTRLGMEIRLVVEQMREQVQNVA